LQQQLKEVQLSSSDTDTASILTLYHGQLLKCDELKALQANINQLIVVNEYFTASNSLNFAVTRAGNSSDQESAIFEISVDRQVKIRPFAKISNRVADVREYLFSFGTIFRVTSIKKYSDTMWLVKLQLKSEEENDFKKIQDHFKLQVGGEITFNTLGHYLLKLDEWEKAEQYYKCLSSIISIDTNSFSQCRRAPVSNDELSSHPDSSRSELSLHKTDQTTELDLKILPPSLGQFSPSMVCSNLGFINTKLNQFDSAKRNFDQAQHFIPNDPISNLHINFNLGGLYYKQKSYSEALNAYEKALRLAARILPSEDPIIMDCLNNISVVIRKQNDCVSDNDNRITLTGKHFTAVWLTHVSITQNIELEDNLHRIFGYVKTFVDRKELGIACEDRGNVVSQSITYVHTNPIAKVYFIISHPKNIEVTAILHDHQHIQSIFIYCQNKTEHQQLLNKNYIKETSVFADITQLFYFIQQDITKIVTSANSGHDSALPDEEHDIYVAKAIPPVQIFSKDALETPIRHLNKESVAFIWFQLLTEILIHLPKSQKAMYEMLRVCRLQYKDDIIEEKNIAEFENNYKPAKAIWWYTKGTFLFRLMNKAFGTQDIDYIYAFRLIVSHLHKQIIALAYNHDIKLVYRGKKLPTPIIQNLKDNINGLISVNGFLSTTKDESVARLYADKENPRQGCQSVIFKLHFDKNVSLKPNAYIKEFSTIEDEEEVLFTIGSVWRIINVEEETDVWCIELRNDQDEHGEELINYLIKQIGEKPTLLTLGKFLYEKGDLDKAEYYCRLLLEELRADDALRGFVYNMIGCIRFERNDIYVAKDYFDFAVNLLKKTHSSCSSSNLTVKFNKQIAEKHQPKHPQVLQAKFEASEVATHYLPSTDFSLAKHYNNIGLLYHKRDDNENAMKNLRLALEKCGTLHIYCQQDMSMIKNNIAGVHYKKGEYKQATDTYQEAIRIGLEILLPTHPWIKDYTNNLTKAIKHLPLDDI
ncbi:unnamed protein product, partial [Didymodactylos carnosus]